MTDILCEDLPEACNQVTLDQELKDSKRDPCAKNHLPI